MRKHRNKSTKRGLFGADGINRGSKLKYNTSKLEYWVVAQRYFLNPVAPNGLKQFR